MRRTCFGLVLLAGLSVPVAATAADNTVVGVGTGAIAGAVVGGPIGAVVGAVAGGFIGANTPSGRVRRHRRARAQYRRAAYAPAPRARIADGAPERGNARAVASATPVAAASEVSTQPRPATTGSTRTGRGTAWQDPN